VIIINDFEFFINRAKKAMIDRKMKYEELAKLTGKSVKTIQAFFSTGRKSERTANLIATVLKIER